MSKLRAPFPWFGGKSSVASLIWERFGDVPNYVEPFFGSGWCEHPEWKQRPHLGDAGMGVHRPSQQRPHLGNAGMGEIYDYFELLAERLRGVRVCCGDWSRVCGPTPTTKQGVTGVFLDPPYSHEERDPELYAVEEDVAADVRKWCLENGDDARLRIVLCGYDGEGHEALEEAGWDVQAWKARGGYSSQGNGQTDGITNSKRERIWFSPHCLKNGLFD